MDVTPTYAYPGRFSVKYYIKLVLVDERGRQFFKQVSSEERRKHIFRI